MELSANVTRVHCFKQETSSRSQITSSISTAPRWGARPPEPGYYMHVAKPLPADQRLNGKKLAAEVGNLLGAD